MAWRAIQDSVTTSESLASLTDFAERLFWRMLAKSDPWGRLPGSARKIRALCVPLVARATEARIEAALTELREAGRISRYRAKDATVIQIVDFEDNQPSDVLGRSGNRYESKYPDPPTRSSAESVRATPAESESESETEKKSANALSPEVQKIYDHWRQARGKTHGRYNRISPGRLRKIKARLKEYSADELLACIDAVALDPWPERVRHDDLTVIFRNAEQVDRFLAMAETPPSRNGDTASMIAAVAAEMWGDDGTMH